MLASTYNMYFTYLLYFLIFFVTQVDSRTVVPRSYANPIYAIFTTTLFELGPKKLKLSYFPPSYAIFPPQLRYFLLFPPSCAIFFPQLCYFLLFPPSYATSYVLKEKKV
jgi:hypothetical protein